MEPTPSTDQTQGASGKSLRHRFRRARLRKLRQRIGRDAVLLVGNLKVGKTTIYSWLVGRHSQSMVYPGTAVELAAGSLQSDRFDRIVDTPGITSLQDRSQDAHVIRDLLVRKRIGAVLLVLDAKNLKRGLVLALQLAEMEVPTAIALNMIDEATQRGLRIDAAQLSAVLGVPVTPTIAVEGQGLGALRRSLKDARPIRLRLDLPATLKEPVERIRGLLQDYPLVASGLAYQLIADIGQAQSVLDDHVELEANEEIRELVRLSKRRSTLQPQIALTEAEQAQAEHLVQTLVERRLPARTRFADRLAVWTRKPLTGLPIVLLVLALVYLFVGWLGADLLVDLLEGKLFGQWLLPWLEGLVGRLPDSQLWLRELLTGRFGLITVGLVLPIGIVLPVLSTFFFAFALMEDSGYLPRMSLLLDRGLRRIGLNGKGLLPLVMGFSCVTMAVLTTRMLDTRKQRVIATLLLVLALPCAPMLGVMLVMLARLEFGATVLLFGLVFVQFLLVGALANWLLPGRRQDFVLELPPLRMPRLGNTLVKTGQRLVWFLREAIPYFLIGTIAMYALDMLGAIDGMRDAFRPIMVQFLGLPPESADVFLMTFVRREAGAALLVSQAELGLYDGVQAMITLLVMTLMVPCINTLLVVFKERGFVAASAIIAFVMVYSVCIGALVHAALSALEVVF
jgi:ferrous iron transport protein B